MLDRVLAVLRGDYDGRFFAWALSGIGGVLFHTGKCVYCGGDCPMGNIECDRCEQ
jgi:hypothetical protein